MLIDDFKMAADQILACVQNIDRSYIMSRMTNKNIEFFQKTSFALKSVGFYYATMKYKFIRGLISYEKYQRSKHFLKQAAEWTSKAIVSLDLTEDCIKSVKQASLLEGIGNTLKERLKEIETTAILNPDPPLSGRFCSSASAILVTMYVAKQHGNNDDPHGDKVHLVKESLVQNIASQICEENFIADKNKNGSVLCPAWWRMSVLIGRGLIKKRSAKKQVVYELLGPGVEIARRLVSNIDISHIEKLLPQSAEKHTVPKRAKMEVAPPLPAIQETSLYTNDDGTDGLELLIDTQELGGDRASLSLLIDLVKQQGVRYRTQRLAVGDYAWVSRREGNERPLPILLERKRADDVARSLVDGRFFSQIEKMISWKDRVTSDHVMTPTCISYLIEGDPGQYVVKCGDGCGGVTQCGYPDLQTVQGAIRELEEKEELDVIRSDDLHGTVNVLIMMTADLQRRLGRGDFEDFLHGPKISVTQKSYFAKENKNDVGSSRTSWCKKKEVSSKTQSSLSTPNAHRQVAMPTVPLAQYHLSSSPQKRKKIETVSKPPERLEFGEIPMVRASYTPEIKSDHQTYNNKSGFVKIGLDTVLSESKLKSPKQRDSTVSGKGACKVANGYHSKSSPAQCNELSSYHANSNSVAQPLYMSSNMSEHGNLLSSDPEKLWSMTASSGKKTLRTKDLTRGKSSNVAMATKYQHLATCDSEDELPSLTSLQFRKYSGTKKNFEQRASSASRGLKEENFSNEVETIRCIFPGVPVAKVTHALNCCHGDVNTALSWLCDNGDQNLEDKTDAGIIDLT